MGKNVLVVGSGGREHALGYGLSESKLVDLIYFVPGNGGTAALPKSRNIDVAEKDIASFSIEKRIDLVVIGPDGPVVAGLADKLRAKGLNVFGPSKKAARLEGSKAYATKFMQAHNIALPPSRVVKNLKAALAGIKSMGGFGETVIKADGLARGKGVFLPESDKQATAAIKAILSGKVDGKGQQLVIQKRYHGPEVSVFALSDGKNLQIIPISSQDHKRILVGDKGPMTGGVGAYAPLPEWMLTPKQWLKIKKIAKNTIDGMLSIGTPYEGVLYLGLMLAEETGGDPIVIEYNARFGDPETEVIIPLLVRNKIDIFVILDATARHQLSKHVLPENISGTALTICLTAANYPSEPQINDTIHGLNKSYDDVIVFHGNTKKTENKLITTGGRVVFVTGLAPDLEGAAVKAKKAIGSQAIHFKGNYFRTDIGYRVFGRT